jgi:hypothetical protein
MIKRIALSGAFFVCIAGFAQAATVSGTFGGTIDAPSNAKGSIEVTGAGSKKLAWGSPSDEPTDTDVVAGNSSSLAVNGGSFGEDVSVAGKIRFGKITWNNQSNWNTGSIWDSNVNLRIDFDVPTGLAVLDQSFGFSITNTPDVSYTTGNNEETGLNPDVIGTMILSSTAFGVPIKLGDGLVLKRVFFDLEDAGTAGTKTTISSFNSATGEWINREGGTSTIGVYGNISAVPLPAGLWLLLGGLGSLAAVRRRAKEIV